MTSVFGGVPDPAPVDPAVSDSSGKRLLNKLKPGKAAGVQNNSPSAAVPPEIATPAPPGVETPVAAGDVTEDLNRSLWTDVRDAEDAELTILRAMNVWLVAYQRLTEGWLVEEVRLMLASQTAREKAQRAFAVADERTVAFKVETDPKAARRLRHDAILARRIGQKLEARAQRIETRAREVTSMIDSTPLRVRDEISVVIANFWLNFHRRAIGKHNLKGTYETPEARVAASKVDFQERFRKIDVPSAKAIAGLIAEHRTALRPASPQPDAAAPKPETGGPATAFDETEVERPVVEEDVVERPKPQLIENVKDADNDEAAA